MSNSNVETMHALIDEAVATHFHPDNMPDDFDQYQPSRFRRIFGSRITKVVAGVTTAAALLSGCVFNTSGTPAPDGRPDVTIPTDGGADAADGGDSGVDGGDSGSDADAAPVQENCSVAGDEDNNGLADCADPACYGQTGPGPVLGTCGDEETLAACADNYDNDGDGKIDCQDEDCFGTSCAEVCGDGLDNDGDGKTDCQDEDCFDPSCAEDCTNPGDEDQNGLEGCLDPACDGVQGCELGTEVSCGDLFDNDADGKIDCADEDCFDASCDEVCDDDQDNNLDGLTDCEEESCDLFDADKMCVNLTPHERNCTDGIDNDNDGDTDCDDAACEVTVACGYTPEICNNGIDDNGDNRIDCEEAACALDASCVEAPNCDPLPEGSSCPTGLPVPNHVGYCPQAWGDLPRGCQ